MRVRVHGSPVVLAGFGRLAELPADDGATDDGATRELMERFYQRLLSGGALGDVAAAMQGAMVSMIRDGRWTALQWAAFVVYGLPRLPAAAS